MNNIIAIDVNGLFCPIYFVNKATFFHSLKQFINTLIAIIRPYNHYKIIMACDMCTRNHRYNIYPQYKASRVSNNDLKESLVALQRILVTYGLPMEGSDIYEADDIIASHVYHSDKCIIMGIDKDFYQLISPKVTVYHPFKKLFVNGEFVMNKFGVSPEKFALFQALCGDSSDNIPGIKGVGPKMAANIIKNTTNIKEFSMAFPKYDFSTLDTMLQLTTLKVFDVQHKPVAQRQLLDILLVLQKDLQDTGQDNSVNRTFFSESHS